MTERKPKEVRQKAWGVFDKKNQLKTFIAAPCYFMIATDLAAKLLTSKGETVQPVTIVWTADE